MLLPLSRTSPSVGVSSCRIRREVVVLPQPDSPTSTSVSPCLISKLTPSTALTWPTVRIMSSPLVTGKYLRTPCTRRREVVMSPPASSNRQYVRSPRRSLEDRSYDSVHLHRHSAGRTGSLR